MINNFSSVRKVGGLMLSTRAYLRTLTTISTLVFALRWAIRYIFFQFRPNIDLINVYPNSNKISLYANINRPDLQSIIPSSESAQNIVSLEIKRRHHFTLNKLCSFIRLLFVSKFKIERFLFLIAVFELNEIKYLLQNKVISKHINFIFYNEKQYWEGLYCIALQEIGFTTYSIAHGFYRDTGRIVSLENSNPVNYLYQISKTQLCWGSIQKNIMASYDTSGTEYVILGKQKLMLEAKTSGMVGPQELNVLILDTFELRTLNMMVIQSLKEIKGNIYIKRHPDDKFDYGVESVDDLLEISENVSIYWGTNSSAILQIGRAGYAVGLYKKSDFLKYIDNKCLKSRGNFFLIDSSYDWRPFIDRTGNEYVERLTEICS